MLISALMEANKLAIYLICGQFSTFLTGKNYRYFRSSTSKPRKFPFRERWHPRGTLALDTPQASHHVGQLTTLHLLHYSLHLLVLLEQSVKVLNLCS